MIKLVKTVLSSYWHQFRGSVGKYTTTKDVFLRKEVWERTQKTSLVYEQSHFKAVF